MVFIEKKMLNEKNILDKVSRIFSKELMIQGVFKVFFMIGFWQKYVLLN
jgi:hypothetical protein